MTEQFGTLPDYVSVCCPKSVRDAEAEVDMGLHCVIRRIIVSWHCTHTYTHECEKLSKPTELYYYNSYDEKTFFKLLIDLGRKVDDANIINNFPTERIWRMKMCVLCVFK